LTHKFSIYVLAVFVLYVYNALFRGGECYHVLFYIKRVL